MFLVKDQPHQPHKINQTIKDEASKTEDKITVITDE